MKMLDELIEVNRSITKIFGKLKTRIVSNNKVLDELKERNTSNRKILDELTAQQKQIDRNDYHTFLMMKARCQKEIGMDRKEVKGVCDALSLLFIVATGADYDSAKERLVDAMYGVCTRDLFAKITGKEWIDEKQALASLKDWHDDANKESKLKRGDTDDDNGYSAHAETDVVETFIKILAPFDAVNVDKKQAHNAAKKILQYDETGLAVSLIIASLNDKQGDKGGCWGWKVLEFDGYSHSPPGL
jgi:hypothetical protein